MKHKIYHHFHKKRLIITWEKYRKMIKDLAKNVEDEFSLSVLLVILKAAVLLGGLLQQF